MGVIRVPKQLVLAPYHPAHKSFPFSCFFFCFRWWLRASHVAKRTELFKDKEAQSGVDDQKGKLTRLFP